jgi:hypothetical protein
VPSVHCSYPFESCIPDHAPVALCIKLSCYFLSVGQTKLCLHGFFPSDVTRNLCKITVRVSSDLSGRHPEHYLVRLKITVTCYVISEFGLATFCAICPTRCMIGTVVRHFGRLFYLRHS